MITIAAHGIQAVDPIMIHQHSGHIVNTPSMAGLFTSPGLGSWCPPPPDPLGNPARACRNTLRRSGAGEVRTLLFGAATELSKYRLTRGELLRGVFVVAPWRNPLCRHLTLRR